MRARHARARRPAETAYGLRRFAIIRASLAGGTGGSALQNPSAPPTEPSGTVPRVLRAYATTIEAVLGHDDEVAVARLLEALAKDADALKPAVTIEPQGTLIATFTVHADGLDQAGTIASRLFGEAVRQAAVPVEGWSVATKEGRLVNRLR